MNIGLVVKIFIIIDNMYIFFVVFWFMFFFNLYICLYWLYVIDNNNIDDVIIDIFCIFFNILYVMFEVKLIECNKLYIFVGIFIKYVIKLCIDRYMMNILLDDNLVFFLFMWIIK